MELHLALRNIIKTDGPHIITEGRIVNILCDFQALNAIPASKYVLRAMIDDGYAEKLLQCSTWNMNAQQLSDQFANCTGFQPDVVWLIFQSLAYGLGWINLITTDTNTPARPISQQQKKTKFQLGKNPSISEINDYLTSIVERLPETEKSFNIEFSNITCVWDMSEGQKDFYYYCNVEVRGSASRDMIIKVISYGKNNNIIDVSELFVYKNKRKTFSVYNINPHINGYDPSDITRIIVYAEENE